MNLSANLNFTPCLLLVVIGLQGAATQTFQPIFSMQAGQT
jgi:hypothetical protein